MGISADDEILQDFLIEAGEILEQLGEQLVELEQQPDDKDLLNAVFRGFHTIKGGAGFLAITALVDICHHAEDVFNILRQGDRRVDQQLMDTMLRVLDVTNAMFEQIHDGRDPIPAEATLLQELENLSQLNFVAAPAPAQETDSPEDIEKNVASEPLGDLTDHEFESLLQAVQPKDTSEVVPSTEAELVAVSSEDTITEDEFEILLDQLHGKGKHSGIPSSETMQERDIAPEQSSADSEEITGDEFEALLDQLHGKDKHNGIPTNRNFKHSNLEASSTASIAKAESVQALQDSSAPSSALSSSSTKAAPTSESTVRVDTRVLDNIMNLVGELVLVRNRLHTLKSTIDDSDIEKAVENLGIVTSDLQLAAMKTRMQPIKKVFGRFPRVVRDLARSLNKEIVLELKGEDTDLDKNLVEALADPLVHLVRNAVDHGIENTEERASAGKDHKGKVVLSACQEGDHIVLSIEDDGKGMDADILRKKAVEKGMMDSEAATRLDNNEAYNLIFAPGFSTKTEISDVSGRGVGMDVVKTRIVQMNGTVEIESTPQEGTRIVIKVPLTLAIMPTLMVELGNQIFALPLASVVEILKLDLTRTNTIDGQLVVLVRDKALPLFFLRQWLIKNDFQSSEPTSGHVVVVQAGRQRVGFVVDNLIGQEEVVIKPLGDLLHGIEGMAGATITGDGKIALILDIPGMMKKYVH